MGHGIAYAAAISGFNVLMLDLTKNQATKGLQKIYQILDKSFKKALSQNKNWSILKAVLK